MCIDVDSDILIWMINKLHYSNYEAIPCSSITCHYSVQGASLGQTVSSYGWCNGIPHVVPVFSLFQRISTRLNIFIMKRKRFFHALILSVAYLENVYASKRLSYRHNFTCRPCHTFYVIVVVFMSLYVHTYNISTISASLIVVYSDGSGVVPKVRRKQRKASSPKILMHVNAILVLMWKLLYAKPRSVFPIRMFFEGHLMRIDAIMWSITRRQNP